MTIVVATRLSAFNAPRAKPRIASDPRAAGVPRVSSCMKAPPFARWSALLDCGLANSTRHARPPAINSDTEARSLSPACRTPTEPTFVKAERPHSSA